MYIPHEIGDKVYFFNKYTPEKTLCNGTIKTINITEEWVSYLIESNGLLTMLAIELKAHQFYPSKAVAKEELLRRAVHYANESLIDL